MESSMKGKCVAQMDQKKMVSIVVSTYRRDTMLMRALESIAKQTTDDYEIILVDDNSMPEWNCRVKQIAEDFCCRYPQITLTCVCNEENLGSALARNRGIEKAQGEYVTFLDDDDYYLPEKVKRQLDFMRSNEIDYCVTDLELYFENEALSERRIRQGFDRLERDDLLKHHFLYHITGTDTMMFRRDYLHQVGMFPPVNIGDEFYLMRRAIDGGGKFGCLPGCDVRAYVHTGEGGLSSGQGKIDGENRLYEYKKKFFHRFDAKTVRGIRMRHYAVLAFAGLRKGSYFFFIWNAMIGFLCAPVQSLQMMRNRKRRSDHTEAENSSMCNV